MNILDNALESWSQRTLSLLRVVTAYLFVQHGTPKLLHVPHAEIF